MIRLVVSIDFQGSSASPSPPPAGASEAAHGRRALPEGRSRTAAGVGAVARRRWKILWARWCGLCWSVDPVRVGRTTDPHASAPRPSVDLYGPAVERTGLSCMRAQTGPEHHYWASFWKENCLGLYFCVGLILLLKEKRMKCTSCCLSSW